MYDKLFGLIAIRLARNTIQLDFCMTKQHIFIWCCNALRVHDLLTLDEALITLV